MFPKNVFKFKEESTEDERKRESESIFKKYPENIPVIVEKHPSSKLPRLSQTKFLLNSSLRAYHLTLLIRKKMNLNKADALYLFINGHDLLKTDTQLNEAYKRYKDSDGFLYVCYHEYSSFGNCARAQN